MELDEKACPYCAETIKAEAIKCRYCGELLNNPAPAPIHVSRSKGGKIFQLLILIPLCGFGFLLALGAILKHSETPDERAKAVAANAIELCWKDVDDELLSRSTRGFAREACQRMAAEYEAKYGRSSFVRKE